MEVINKFNTQEVETPSNLVIGTEGGNIFVIDGNGSKIIYKNKLASIPTAIATYGAYEADYRVHIACRNEQIYTIRNGELMSTCMQISSRIINIQRLDKGIYLATTNNYFNCYSPDGKKSFSLKMPSEVYCVEQCKIVAKKFTGILLGLKNSEVRLYNDKVLVSLITIPETIMGLKFGKLGKIDDVLVVVSNKGSIYLKSLDKNVYLDSTSYKKSSDNVEEGSLNIPKKTTLYLDLIEREKENYRGML